jgi:prepilin-type N-terminal cleavage/methylation domain-containing protein
VSPLRDERGLTLVELLVVMLIGGIVLAGVTNLMQVVIRQSAGVVSRTDASQRGRLAMDRMTRQLRSQVCVDLGYEQAKPALAAANRDEVTFYMDLSDGTRTPVKRGLQYRASDMTIVEKEYDRISADGARPTTYATTPSRTTVLLDNVTAEGDFFRFFKYSGTGTARTDNQAIDGATSLGSADLAAVARITISMDVRPAAAKRAEPSTVLRDSVHVRNLNENTEWTPTNPKALKCQ